MSDSMTCARNGELVSIDVVIPVFNSENYLPACLESLCASDGKNVRFILVDDGSTDATPAICDEFCAEHENALVIHRENGGSSAARNTGYAAVDNRGCCHWVWFVDSDDVVAPGALDILANYAAGSEADVLNLGFVRFDDDSRPDWSSRQGGFSGVVDARAFLAGTYESQYHHYLWGFLFRCASLDRLIAWREKNGMAGLCDESYSLLEDLVFVEEFMQETCKRVESIPDVLYGYRQLSSSISHSVNPKAADSALRAMRYIDGFEVPERDRLPKYRMQIALLFNAYRAVGQDDTSAVLRRVIRREIESRVRAVGLRQLTRGLLMRYLALKTGAGDLVLKIRTKR